MAARTGLKREAVIGVAGALVDRAGADQLTMTAVARELHVQGPSLHHHVGTIDELRADVQVQALDDLANRLQRAAMGRVGPECFRALADELCAYAIEHPGLYELSQSEPVDPARALAASEPARAALTAVIESFGIHEPPLDLLLTCLAPLHGVLALDRSGVLQAAQRALTYRRVTEMVIKMLETEGNA